jgi:hypothetical protein
VFASILCVTRMACRCGDPRPSGGKRSEDRVRMLTQFTVELEGIGRPELIRSCGRSTGR